MGDMTRLLLLLWAGVSVSSAVDLQKRIIGGDTCKDGERRYHVYVQGNNVGKEFTCGGSLISDQWILTAAHCEYPRIYVYLGVHPGERVLDDSKRIQINTYEIYRDSDGDHDLMLLKLPETIDKLPKLENIQPICLPSDAECKLKNSLLMVQVAGYGAMQIVKNKKTENGIPDTLQCADIPVDDCSSLRTCLSHPKNKALHDEYHYQDWLCYKDSTKDTSQGDSGGGVVHGDKIYGVHSFSALKVCTHGSASMDLCSPKYRRWIKKFVP